MLNQASNVSNAALKDEIEAVNAIYGADVLTPVVPGLLASSTTGSSSHAATSSGTDNAYSKWDKVVLRPPDQAVSFLLFFDHEYPSSLPRVHGTQSIGRLGKGQGHQAVAMLEETLRKVWIPGAVCLFDLIEEANPLLQNGSIDEVGTASEHGTGGKRNETTREAEGEKGVDRDVRLAPSHNYSCTASTKLGARKTEGERAAVVPTWIVSEPIAEKKSVFVARCARITDKAEAATFLTELLSTNKKLASATHNISAWRTRDAQSGVVAQDCDDDGETAAGGRLLHLMQLMDVWNVVVVVTRWYGGVKLGPDRFRLINQVARDALIQAGVFNHEQQKVGKRRNKS